MSGRREGRHRISDDEPEGRHRAPEADRQEGRHRAAGVRSAAVQRAAIPPLMTASGAVAAAAMTALVLSGQGESLGQLFADRQDEPRPSATASTPRTGAPTDADIAGLVAGWSPGLGGMGSSLSGSLWDVLFPSVAGAPSSVLTERCVGGAGGALLRAGIDGGGTWTGTTSVAAQSTSWWTASSPAPAALGSPGAGTQPGTAAEEPGPSSGPAPSGTTAPQSEVDAPTGTVGAPLPGPVVQAADPVTEVLAPATDPVTNAAAPVTDPVAEAEAVAPVTESAVKAAAPVTEPVAEVVAPVTGSVAEAEAVAPVTESAVKVTESVAKAVAPVTETVAEVVAPVTEPAPEPTDIPSGEDVPTVQFPG